MTIKISLKSLKLKTVIITKSIESVQHSIFAVVHCCTAHHLIKVKWNVLVYKAHFFTLSSVFFFLFVMELADLKWLLFAKGRIEISITSSR
ncbi:hypothetical protein T03_12273 [Trichinella britovi]|uniref:Uncharacterized protein n=1 Tax=Trichinella britovi TaxID=45882 RepID=A0A0V1DFD9_TRIBR|nr:hypothetical protein T03_12273 [Trichinella britovi]